MPSRIALAAASVLLLLCACSSKEPSGERGTDQTPSPPPDWPVGPRDKRRQEDPEVTERRLAEAIERAQSTPTQVELAQPFWLGYSRTTSVNGTPLKITFSQLIEDSRCRGTCVWAGRVAVELRIASGSESTTTQLGTQGPNSVSAFGYRIQLEEVSSSVEDAQGRSDPRTLQVQLKIFAL
jgi:hypothetical protein